jgi:BirA family biotin operon repressor/biotin-[acetyl-CoA-carboxylase] ligase
MSEQDFVISVGSQLHTRFVGKPLHFFDSLDSTNTYAMQLAREGASEGTVIVADAQSGGKGRLGRSWVSPAGVNLYCSLILRPCVPAVLAPQLNLLAAVAVAEAIVEVCGITPTIKWPNDVLVNGKKVCGILSEMQTSQTSRDTLKAVVVGIGVNLNAQLDAFPEELREKASSLCLITGESVERGMFAASLLTHLEQSYLLWLQEGFPVLRSAWERYASGLIGKQIAVAAPEGVMSGTVLGLDSDGALLVREQLTDAPRRVVAGDVTVIDGYTSGEKHDPRD